MHVSFSEIVLILLVALLVIKPERLPEVATTLGQWLKGIRRLVSNFKNPEKYFFPDEKKE